MKTLMCWLIANLESHLIIIFLCALMYKLNTSPNHVQIIFSKFLAPESISLLIILVILAFIFSLWTAIFTYKNFNEVISRQFRWRNSNVEIFSSRLYYTSSRFAFAMTVYSSYLLIFLFGIFSLHNNF